jgi:hypothetical protein
MCFSYGFDVLRFDPMRWPAACTDLKPMKIGSMKTLLLVLSLLCAMQGSAQTPEQLPTLTEYFKTAPLYLVGRVRFEKAHRLFHDQIAGMNYLEGSLQPDKDLNIWLSRDELRIKTNGGLLVRLAGVPVTVTALKYNHHTHEVYVESATLGIDAGNFYVEKRMAQEIKTRFEPKLEEAFAKLVQIRQQQTLSAAGDALNAVIEVFSPKPKPGAKRGTPLPTFVGEVSLITLVPRAQTVRIGKAVADIEKNDSLESSILLRAPSRKKVQIRGLMFSSAKGLVVRTPEGSAHGIKTATLNSFSATEDYGFQLDGTNGADALISGTRLMISLIRVADRGIAPTEAAFTETKPANLIQQIINAKAQDGLRDFVRSHRADLLKAGATPELLNALEVDHPPAGKMPFLYPNRGY